MSWNSIVGQQRVKQLLQRAIERKQIAHAYLFYGGEGIGQDAGAIEFAKVLNCLNGGSEACGRCNSCRKVDALQHPDVKLIFELPIGRSESKDDDPFEKLTEDQIAEIRDQIRLKAEDPYHRIVLPKANFIKINSVREIKRGASMTSFEAGRKVFIVSNAEKMNAEASNSLLKTLEEPPPHTLLILTTSEKGKLLQTIVSRCQLVQFDQLPENEIREALISRDGAGPDQAQLLARLANGSYSLARDLLSKDVVGERAEVVEFLRAVLAAQKISLIAVIEKVSSMHDRSSLERWLKLLHSWLRDALMLREGGKGSILNIDHSKELESFVQKFPEADLLTAVGVVERHIALLNKNGYLPLVLTNLAIDLRKYLSLRIT